LIKTFSIHFQGIEVKYELLENIPKVVLRYDQLDSFAFTISEPFVLAVEWGEIMYEFLIRMKENSSHLLILGSGAMNLYEKRIKPPFFQRHSWMNSLNDSVIYYNDPTLYLGDHLLVGWGQGTRDRFALKEIAEILHKLIFKSHIPAKNTIFYGSSAGGFMSLFLAGYIKDSLALVNSPQTCLSKWLQTPVRQVFELSYQTSSIDDVMKLFPERINVIKFYQSIKYVPKIYYLQNAYCEYDIKGHVIPFIDGLQKMGSGCVVNPVKLDFYYIVQPGPPILPAIGGHGALGITDTIKYMNKIKTEF
jgi:hypothetical protein